MGLEHLYGRIVTVALGALLGVCALLATAKFVRRRARLLSPLVRAHGALFAVMMGLMAMVGMFRSFGKLPQNYGIMELWNYGNEALGIDGEAQFHNASMSQSHNSIISESDVTNGWRMAETRESCEIVGRDAFDAPQIHAPWLARGGYKDKTRIAPYGWTFPWRDGILEGITVFSEGELRVNVHTNYFPMPFDAPLAVVPSFNWNLLPGGASNVFWHVVSPSNSLVVTWENSPVNRDVNSLTNFQAELFADGSFEYRYDDHTVAYSRVHPLDLDFDGLPNAIDPEPETPQGAAVWNQSDAWAAVAFPSNAAEIVSAGGYAAWVAQRVSDPNRRLVGLNVALQGGRWPVCVEVGGVPVMADGSAELLYAIDCGAQVPLSLLDGELNECAIVELWNYGNEALGIGGETQFHNVTLLHLHNFTIPQSINCVFPYECMTGDVVVYLDSPRTGWIRRTAEVSVDDQYLTHLYPGNSAQLTAVVTNCHPNAYLGCTWSGGNGISFLDPHSLNTIVSYTSTNFVQWATNHVSLVTEFAGGYSLTNAVWFTVGIEEEPTPCFTLGSQEVFFLNDADIFDSSEFPTNRPERIRPVTLNLLGPYGTNGTVKLSAQGAASPVLFYIDNGVTNLITATTELPLEVTDQFARTGTNTFYVSCLSIGTGTISATLTLEGGETLTDTVSFKCIEPLRKLVSMRQMPDGRFYNPSRLVVGTNAVLHVGVNGDFDATNVDWRVSGPGRKVSTSGWCCTVEPTGTGGVVTVEARFNDDEIQPKFVLPVVMPRIIPVKAFIVEPPESMEGMAWEHSEIHDMINEANKTFSQVGIRFELVCEPENVGTPNDWAMPVYDVVTNAAGKLSYSEEITDQMAALLDNYRTNDCVEVYFTGALLSTKMAAFYQKFGIVVSKAANRFALAHEFGHALGLKDIYYMVPGKDAQGREVRFWLPSRNDIIKSDHFDSWPYDWGEETGRGFYGRGDTLATTIDRLLMHGHEHGWTGDIPDRRVRGLSKTARDGHQKVGATEIEKDDRKVYTR